MRLRAAAFILLATALILCAPPAAGADVYRQVLSTYEAQGTIPPCRFSSPQLEAALRGEDAYGAQYFADFTDAIQSALAQRASGACTPSAPASATIPTGSAVPGVIVVLGGLALAGGLLAVLSRVAGSRILSWADTAHHAAAEAGFRAAGRLERLADALRAKRRPAP